jgi:TP901 family phage tail tape measure protein
MAASDVVINVYVRNSVLAAAQLDAINAAQLRIAEGAKVASVAEEASFSRIGSSVQSAGSKIMSFGSGMISAGRSLSKLSVPILALAGYSVYAAMNFEKSMTLIQTQAGASAAEVKEMTGRVLDLSDATGVANTQLSQALYWIESVGYRGAKAYTILKAAAEGAKVGNTDAGETGNLLAGIMKNNLKDVTSAGQAMGKIIAIIGRGKLTMADFSTAVGRGILSFGQQAGLGLTDIGAAMDTLTQKHVPAAQAMTGLRFLLKSMVAPTAAATAQLALHGMSQYQLAADLRKPNGLITALKDLRAHLAGMSKIEQTAFISSIFGGARGLTAGLPLINGLGNLEGNQRALQGAGASTLNKAFNVTAQTAAFKMAKAINEIKNAFVRLGIVLIPVVIPALLKLAGLVVSVIKWFTHLPGPIRTIITDIVMVVAVLGPLLMALGFFISVIGTIISVIGSLIVIFRAVVLVISVSPWILALLAITAIVVIFIKLYEHCKAFRDIVQAVFAWLKGAFMTVVNFIKSYWQELFPGLYLFVLIYKNFGKIVAFVKTLPGKIAKAAKGMWDGIKQGLTVAINWVVNKLNGLIKIYNGSLGAIAGFFGINIKLGYLSPLGQSISGGGSGEGPMANGQQATRFGTMSGREQTILTRAVHRYDSGHDTKLQKEDFMEALANMNIIGAPTTLKIDGRTIAEATTAYTLQRKARL